MSLYRSIAWVSTDAAQIRYAVDTQDSVVATSSLIVDPFEARQLKPRIKGIGWVSKLVRIAKNADAFADLAKYTQAKQCLIADPAEMVRRARAVIVRSRHAKKLRPETVRGISAIPIVRNGRVFGIKSPGMLCPKPAAMPAIPQQLAQRIERSQPNGAGHP